MTIEQWCSYLGWSIAELSRRAGIDYRSALKAHSGTGVSGRIQQAIAEVISSASGKRVNVGDIVW